jgi:hypothetical protein
MATALCRAVVNRLGLPVESTILRSWGTACHVPQRVPWSLLQSALHSPAEAWSA